MKLSVKLTMQGLIRALQGRGHDLAEEVERGRRPVAIGRPAPRPARVKGGRNAIGRR